MYTDANGMVIIRAALPANIGKPVVEALNTVIAQVAATPLDEELEEVAEVKHADEGSDASADAPQPHAVINSPTLSV